MKELQLALQLKQVMQDLSPQERLNLAGFLACDGQGGDEIMGHVIDIPSRSLDFMRLIADCLRQSIKPEFEDFVPRFIVIATSLMANTFSQDLYLKSSEGKDVHQWTWTPHLEQSQLFTHVWQANKKAFKAHRTGLVCNTFVIAIPNFLQTTCLGGVIQ